jgi:hypothetical protein
LQEGKYNETEVAEQYCWAITQASGWSCCGQSGCDVLKFGLQLDFLVHTHILTADHMYTHILIADNIYKHIYLWLTVRIHTYIYDWPYVHNHLLLFAGVRSKDPPYKGKICENIVLPRKCFIILSVFFQKLSDGNCFPSLPPPPKSLNIMRYDSKSLSNCRTILMLLYFEIFRVMCFYS